MDMEYPPGVADKVQLVGVGSKPLPEIEPVPLRKRFVAVCPSTVVVPRLICQPPISNRFGTGVDGLNVNGLTLTLPVSPAVTKPPVPPVAGVAITLVKLSMVASDRSDPPDAAEVPVTPKLPVIEAALEIPAVANRELRRNIRLISVLPV